MNSVFELGDIRPRRYFLLVTAGLGVLLALLRPESTTDRGFFLALAQWLAQVGVPMLFAVVLHMALHRVSRIDRWNRWLKLFLSGSIAAVLFTPIAYALDQLLGTGGGGDGLAAGWLQEFLGLYPAVVFTWMLINVPFHVGYRLQRAATRTAAEPVPPRSHEPPAPGPAPFFMNLVPVPVRGELVSLKSELHYLEVTTTAGRALILYNLRDAVRELDPDSGCQTHRSYWASLDQAAALVRRGRSAVLKMQSGTEVPVSRNRVAGTRPCGPVTG